MIDLEFYGSCTLDDDGCATCGDVAVPVRVVALTSEGTAVCEDRIGSRKEIMLDFAPDADTGDILMVHVGVAIGKVQ